MKKILLPLAAAAVVLTSFAFVATNACDGNVMFVKGTVAKNGYYKADGTLTGTGTSTVKDVTTNGDSTIATLETTYTDEKKKDDPHTGTMRFICVGDKIIMDMSGFINSMMPQNGSAKDMRIEMTGNLVPYKTTYAAGEKLPDIHSQVKTYNKDQLMMTTDINITNRVCDAVEDKTTPAGTYHCYKISEITETSTAMGTFKMPGGKPRKSVQWFCPTAGVVRMENYDGDKISTYNELLSLVKP